MTFADWLLFKRRKRKISQGDLAKALDISHQTVSAWETNRAVPKLNPRQMKIFCTMLDCSWDELADAFGTTDLDVPQLERNAG